MKLKKLNWPIWLGFLLSIFAFFSYPLIFVNWDVTRDFPWANLFLFATAVVLLFVGVRRAFAPEKRRLSKIAAPILATLSVLALAMFIFTAFVASRWLPASQGAPQVGKTVPEFTLANTNNKPVSLSELRSQSIDGKAPKGVLLIFYRGYW